MHVYIVCILRDEAMGAEITNLQRFGIDFVGIHDRLGDQTQEEETKGW